MPDLDIPICEPADLAPRAPRSGLPANAIDTHFHVFGPRPDYPFASGRSYTAPDASLADYEHLARKIGFSRAVVVQPSVYGTDNRRTLDVLREARIPMRAVIVADETLPEREWLALHKLGVRGVRINLVFKAGNGLATARALASRIRELGWHLQFLVDVSTIADLADWVRALRVPAVFDHFGHVPTARGLADPGFQALLDLVREGSAWVKLSGAYRITGIPRPPYDDVRPFAEALLAANPERVLWATDWPHPAISVPMPNDGDLVDMALDWTTDPGLRRKLFVTNAERLYGFDTAISRAEEDAC
ncbi:GntR family transcriptional regulator [Mesorhizobium sp. 113-3-9]|nr:GntR family transcriptional regulator [Mesorhizobium sp. 113-3-9]